LLALQGNRVLPGPLEQGGYHRRTDGNEL